MRIKPKLLLLQARAAAMCTIKQKENDEAGLSLVEAMFSIAILSIAALGIGAIMTSSFQQTNTAENVLNSQVYGMSEVAVTDSGTYSTAADIPVNVSIRTESAISTNNMDTLIVVIPSKIKSNILVSATTASVTSGTNLPSWWLP
jgi:Tfp pilus assembly protein FimT